MVMLKSTYENETIIFSDGKEIDWWKIKELSSNEDGSRRKTDQIIKIMEDEGWSLEHINHFLNWIGR